MKTAKIMKIIYTLLIPVFVMALLTPSYAQEKTDKKKEVKLKMVKEENGKTVVVDTTLKVSDLENLEDNPAMKEFLENNGIEDLNMNVVNIKDVEDMDVVVYNTDEEDGSVRKKIIIKSSEDQSIEEEFNFVVVTSDSTKPSQKITVTVDGDNSYYLTDDEDIHKINAESNGKASTIIVKKRIDGKEADIFVSDDDINWHDKGEHKQIKIEDGEDGKKKVIIENEDGTKKEILIDDEKGAYLIDEDGNLKKVADDAVWIGDEAEMITLDVEENEDGTIVIKKNGKTIELKDFEGENNAFVYSMDVEAEGGDDVDVFIEMITKKEGDKTVTIKKKVVLKNVGEKDMESIEKSGLEIEASEANTLKLEKLVFSPNPSDGKFTLKFKAPKEAKTDILIYNITGKIVFEESIKKFKGDYEKEVDISSEGAGTYFLKIQQGESFKTKKIIIE
jgi:hypothetical protein